MRNKYSGVGSFKVDGENARLDGMNTFAGGEYDEITIEGVNTVTGSIKANRLILKGVFTAKEKLESNYIEVEGVATISGPIRAHEADVKGVVYLKGEKFEADSINCKGVISTKGEISADTVLADGCISAEEIYGDVVKIYSDMRGKSVIKKVKSFLERDKDNVSEVKLIEATTIELVNVTADVVNGHDIIIGENCRINKLDCDGTLRVHSSSTINSVTGNHTYVVDNHTL